jgi:predicted nucleotide-binding protein
MKPKVFIGSSLEAKPVADAIDANLQHEAFPKVWTSGVFGLSESTLSSLMREVRESDFAIFVFGTDDISVIRGELLTVPRDNVVYELGLFSGALEPARCFFLAPSDVEIHLPSDLAGSSMQCLL